MKSLGAALILFLAGEAAQTSATLRIEQLFSVPADPAKVPARRLDEGLMIEIPNLETWKAPPTPIATPTPAPAATPFTAFPTLVPGNKGEIRFGESPYFREDERLEALADTGLAQIRLVTDMKDLCARYTIRAEDDETSPIITMHTGTFTETFRLPAGRYRIDRETWKVTARRPSASTEFPLQDIRGGFLYIGESDRRDAEAALNAIRHAE